MDRNPPLMPDSTTEAGYLLPRRPTGVWPWAGAELSLQPAGANGGVDAGSHENAVEEGQAATMRLFMENIPWGVGIATAQAILLAAALWTLVPTPALLLWFALTLVQSGARIGMYVRYRKEPMRNPEKWLRRLAILAAANGLVCGTFGLLFATLVTVPYQFLILIVLTCLATENALSALKVLPSIFLVFAVTALLPVTVYFLLGPPVQQAAAVAILLAITLQTRFGREHRHAVEAQARAEKQRRELQEELEKKKQSEIHFLRTRTMLMGAMGHDLLHPVNGMRMMVDALRDNPSAPPAIAYALQTGLDALNRQLTAIMNSVRVDPGSYQPEILSLPVQALLERVVADNAPRARAKGVELQCLHTSTWVNADPLLLHSVLDNLVDNAIRHAQRGRVLVGARRAGPVTKLEIWDNGVGIAETEFAHIWQEGYRVRAEAKPAGHGMGLALVKEMADVMGAGLSVRSKPGRGSRFAIRLPAAKAPAPGIDR